VQNYVTIHAHENMHSDNDDDVRYWLSRDDVKAATPLLSSVQ